MSPCHPDVQSADLSSPLQNPVVVPGKLMRPNDRLAMCDLGEIQQQRMDEVDSVKNFFRVVGSLCSA